MKNFRWSIILYSVIFVYLSPKLYSQYPESSFVETKSKEKKREIRKSKNTIEFIPTLQLSQTQFENWATGGDNTFSGVASIFFNHKYHKEGERFHLEYRVMAKYGLNVINSESFKSSDQFNFNIEPSWEISEHWALATGASIVTQFSKGYKSRTDKTIISSLMSPGDIDLSVGFKYEKSPFKVTLSPIAGKIVVVANDTLSKQGLYGVAAGKHSRESLGSSAKVDFDQIFAKKKLRFRSYFHTFTNYKDIHTARWTNTLDIIATKLLTTSIYAELYYDNLATTPKKTAIQYNYSIGVGFSYNFKNK